MSILTAIPTFTDWPEQVPPEVSRIPDPKPYKLYEGKEDFAFYYDGGGPFGFGQALEVRILRPKDFPDFGVVEVKFLSGNSWGQTKEGKPRNPDEPYTLHWIIVKTEYWHTPERWIAASNGGTEVPKGKRKPRPMEPMSKEEAEALNSAIKQMYIDAGLPLPEVKKDE